MYPIITISREVGSGGHAIGEKVAERLGIHFLDRDFIEKVAGTTGYNAEEVEKKGEYASNFDKFFNSSLYNSIDKGDAQDIIYFAQRNLILEEAKKGPCVIVGRCADYILDKEGIPALNVFIHADTEHRIKSMMEREGESRETITKLLKKKDKGRKFYYRFYTEREWGEYKNYQLNLDSGVLGEDMCVDIIVNAAKQMDRK